MREKLTEACRGKGSTLFPSFKMVTTCLVLLLCICCVLGMYVLCILVMRKCLQYVRCFTYDWRCMYEHVGEYI